ncbi:MAG: GNAT family N-acetyltransferase [Candidatus Bathyarchaeota archaeon]|nr:MAG: GNAT family N-acetyltransferase [Candidatus Bathyarchaeota archaeon]
MNLENIDIEILSKKRDISCFSCGEKDIDEFIHTEAMIFQNERLGVTYLFFYEKQLIGFVTLGMADLRKHKMDENDRLSIGRENYPALQISQLAVCKNLQVNYGIGTYICDFCHAQSLKYSEKIGCRFLVLNAMQKAIGFYEKYGFKLLPKQEGRREPIMFLNIMDKKTVDNI